MKNIRRAFGLVGLTLCSVAWGAPDAIPARHQPKTIAGRTFWSVIEFDAMNHPAGGDRMVFKDFLPFFRTDMLAPLPDKGIATWKTMRENFAEKSSSLDLLEKYAATGKPFDLCMRAKRSPLVLGGKVDVDKADYAAWKTAHPGFCRFGSLSEWDNDFLHAYAFIEPPKGEAEYRDLLRFFGLSDQDPATLKARRDEIRAFLGPRPTEKKARLELYRKFFERIAALHYGDSRSMAAFHASLNIGHLAAQWGAGLIAMETTNTSGGDGEYRWGVSGCFTRGAARQFGLPWKWYTAIYMNGYNHDGTWVGNSVCNYLRNSQDSCFKGTIGPAGGVSRSLNKRIWYYAYLNGANEIQQEGWMSVFLRRDAKTGKLVLSPRGEDYADFIDFTRAHPDRGVIYTPVAVLVPNNAGYSTYGAFPYGDASFGYTVGDETTDAVFFSIQPTFERDKAMRRGTEANLYNSPLAMMYDAITPDAQQTSEERLATFKSYKALVVTGDYDDRSFEKELAQYEREGGQVIRISEADLPSRANKTAIALGGEVRSGHRRYPAVEAKLAKLQEAYFPFKVTGDCLYGANRTSDGWWFWAFNNKGIVKFADAYETTVPSCTTSVTVNAKTSSIAAARDLVGEQPCTLKNGTLAFTLKPGEFAIYEIK